MAKVRARPENGRLQLDFMFQGLRCREQTDLPDTPENRAALEATLSRIELEIKVGTFDYERHFPGSPRAARLKRPISSVSHPAAPALPPTLSAHLEMSAMPSFAEFAQIWFAEMEPTWRVATRQLMRTLLEVYLLPEFGERKLDAISRPDLLQFRARLITTPRGKRGRPLSPATVNHVLKLLRALLAEAASRHAFQDPTPKVKRVKIPKSDIKPFTLDEVNLILQRCRPDYRNYFAVRFFTGMRSGEIHGLKWNRIDFERRQILVRETFTHGRAEYTKNDGSQREIAMSFLVYEALRAQHQATGANTHVFCNLKGEPLDEGNVTKRIWYPLLSLLGLERRRPYETRHTCATMWLAAGEAPEWISRQLGHTTTEMLFRVYSRYVPNLTRHDGSAFDRMIAAGIQSPRGASNQSGVKNA